MIQHWRGGLQVLLVKGFFYILEGELPLLLEGELPHILRLFADFAPTVSFCKLFFDYHQSLIIEH